IAVIFVLLIAKVLNISTPETPDEDAPRTGNTVETGDTEKETPGNPETTGAPKSAKHPRRKIFEINEMVEAVEARVEIFRSLEKAADFPIYTLQYNYSYDFAAFLEKGVDSSWYFGANVIETKDSFNTFNMEVLNNNGEACLSSAYHSLKSPCLMVFVNVPGVYSSISLVPMGRLGYPREPAAGVVGGLYEMPVELDSTLEYRLGLLEAPYWPLSGMNECGLAAAVFTAANGENVSEPGKVTLDGPHLIRLMLDYAKDVDEAVSLLKRYNNSASEYHHFLIADRSGNSATIKYSNGEVSVTRSKKPWSPGKKNKNISPGRNLISIIFNLTTGEVEASADKQLKTTFTKQ
ncbi:MAG: linear amide C-N hydrolase, partial [bacterium]|nr:linear amide C-N hydrolase [bacterium]